MAGSLAVRAWTLSLLGLALGFAGQQTPVILISIDTLRADHLGVYGYHNLPTPNIDSLANGGTVFTSVECQVPLTLPSHASLFTSTYPFESRVEENAERVPSGSLTLASVLRSNGYQTSAFIGSVFLEREMGLDQGFDEYDSPFHFQAFSPLSGSMFFGGTDRNPFKVRDRRDGSLVLAAARRWLTSHRGQPAFVFIHLFDLHKPYLPHPSHPDPPGSSGYDYELGYLDGELGNFKKFLMDSGWWDRSLVVLLSDHGEGLGEHGEGSHGYFIYESTVRVPLIFHWPAASKGGAQQDSQPAGLIDVAPSILGYLHIPAPSTFEGIGLGAANGAVYSETTHTRDAFGWAPLRSLRLGKWKFIEAPRPELYDLQADPREMRNLYRPGSPKAAELRTRLDALLTSHRAHRTLSPGAISPQTHALLSSLGYLSGGPQAGYKGSAADPKDRLAEYKLYESAQTHLYNRRFTDAATTLERLLARDPKNLLARRDLCGTYVEEKQYAKARPCFEAVVAAAPADYMAEFELGITEERLGLRDEAIRHLRVACGIAPEAEQCRHELQSLQSTKAR
ncbi:MAG: sulfatase-like hydrolase/transferase [Bryobacteraceae bacterium]